MDSINANNIVDTIPSALLVLDESLRVQSANRAFFRTFSVAPQDPIDDRSMSWGPDNGISRDFAGS